MAQPFQRAGVERGNNRLRHQPAATQHLSHLRLHRLRAPALAFELDVQSYPAPDRIQHFGEAGDGLSCKARIEPASGIEFTQRTKCKRIEPAGTVGRAIYCVIMQHHDLTGCAAGDI